MLFLLVVLAAVTTHGQAPLTEASARAAATIAITEAKGNDDKFLSVYQRELRRIDKDFGAKDLIVIGGLWSSDTENISIIARGPATTYGILVSEAVRKMESPDAVAWPGGLAVFVRPLTVHSADIERIVLTAPDGKQVAPLTSNLKPTENSTLMGVKFVVNSGFVVFPMEAVRAGAVITCIPRAGSNVTQKFEEKHFKDLK